MNLRVPGPTPCPDEVLAAVGRQMMDHRGPEFHQIVQRVTEGLKRVFQTKASVFVLTGSGTGGMEAAIVNTLSPDDRVLVVSIGAFGDRFAKIARVFGVDVVKLDFEQGRAADPDRIRQALRADPAIKAVLVTHNETSTGVTNDLQAIAAVVKGEFDKLLVVDGISSVGSLPCPVDAWKLDVVISGSQKGWMVPPGLVFLAVSERGWKAVEQARMPRFYWDLREAKSYLEKAETPWTPAVSIFYGLDKSLAMMDAEGLESIFTRHRRIGAYTRSGVKALGLDIFPKEEEHASNTVTAVHVPLGVEGGMLTKSLREQHGVVLAGGQASLAGKIFRIGHLGKVSQDDIDGVLSGLKVVLPQVGFRTPVRS